MKKVKHDLELERMARDVMRLPFNKNGSDKSHVLDALFYFNDYFSKVKRHALKRKS